MSNTYNEKYLKYKTKYINLKSKINYNSAPTIPNPISNTSIIKSPPMPIPIPNKPINI